MAVLSIKVKFVKHGLHKVKNHNSITLRLYNFVSLGGLGLLQGFEEKIICLINY